MRTRQKNRNNGSEEKSKYLQLMEDHPLLFDRARLPMTKTCMCWGIECGEGWHTPLRNLCDTLELLNMTDAKKFGLVIRAEQVKEKYGTLRFYYDIEANVPTWRKIAASPFDAVAWVFNTDFRMEKVNEDCKEGNTFKNYDVVWHPRWRYWLYDLFSSISEKIKYANDDRRETRTARGALDHIVENMVRSAEHECYCVCEDCGNQIGNEWSPRCETQGWITYLCKKCAEKRNTVYSFTDPKTGELKYFMGENDVTKETLERRAKMEKERQERLERETKKEE